MKISLNIPDDQQYSILQRVLDGTLSIDDIEEFNEILQIYPEDALLYRKYADLLWEKKQMAAAAAAFDQAANLFIDRGMNLQAIVAKILQWSINRPTHDQGLRFQQRLSDKGSRNNPLQRFWANMSYPELVAIMLRLVRQRFAAGDEILSVDDPANEIYFVVSGTLAETLSEECRDEASRAGIDIEPKLIGANDVFGNIFPLNKPTHSHTRIVAASDVELVKIAKTVLFDACKKHPRIAKLLYALHKPENVDKCDRAWQSVRRSMRYGVPTKVEIISTPATAGNLPKRHTGIAVDISLGGMCVDLGAPGPEVGRHIQKGRVVQLLMDLLNEVALLDVSGKIVWQKQVPTERGEAMLIGVRFDPLNASDRELLVAYCSGNVSEQNLLWSLWDSMVKPDPQ